jgi:hypothetical protein
MSSCCMTARPMSNHSLTYSRLVTHTAVYSYRIFPVGRVRKVEQYDERAAIACHNIQHA